MKVEKRIDIEAPPADIYAVLMDPRRLEDWVSIHENLLEAPDGSLSQGDRLTQRLKVAGQKFTVEWIVTRDEPSSFVEWLGTGPLGTEARCVYDLDPEGDGTCFSYLNEFQLPGGIAGRVAGKAVAGAAGRETQRSLERLKRLLEN